MCDGNHFRWSSRSFPWWPAGPCGHWSPVVGAILIIMRCSKVLSTRLALLAGFWWRSVGWIPTLLKRSSSDTEDGGTRNSGSLASIKKTSCHSLLLDLYCFWTSCMRLCNVQSLACFFYFTYIGLSFKMAVMRLMLKVDSRMMRTWDSIVSHHIGVMTVTT